MISREQFRKELAFNYKIAIREDVGDGHHSSLACIRYRQLLGFKAVGEG